MTREEAIEVVKERLDYYEREKRLRAACEILIPELRESEDERMLRTIIKGFENWKSNGNVTFNNTKVDDILAYLEKQKEQKPTECIEDSVKFEEGFKAGRESGLRDGQKYVLNNLDSYGLCKPAEWSEEDEEMLEYVIGDLNDAKQLFSAKDAKDLCDKEIAWLKSLRPSWKPSEVQMDALEAATVRYQSTGLESLFEDLKKL